MSDVRDQPTPIHRPDLVPVWTQVIGDFGARYKDHHDPAVDRALADMRERDQLGRARYGTPLTVDNGRDHLVDAYQELLDGAAYLKAAVLEGEHELVGLYHTQLDLILKVRMALDARASANLEDKVGL